MVTRQENPRLLHHLVIMCVCVCGCVFAFQVGLYRGRLNASTLSLKRSQDQTRQKREQNKLIREKENILHRTLQWIENFNVDVPSLHFCTSVKARQSVFTCFPTAMQHNARRKPIGQIDSNYANIDIIFRGSVLSN